MGSLALNRFGARLLRVWNDPPEDNRLVEFSLLRPSNQWQMKSRRGRATCIHQVVRGIRRGRTIAVQRARASRASVRGHDRARTALDLVLPSSKVSSRKSCERLRSVWHIQADSSRGPARMATEAVRPSINVPRRMGLVPATGDAVLIAHAVRRKGGLPEVPAKKKAAKKKKK